MLLSLELGIVVGVILALTGAGGGILAVPLLVFGARVSVAQAGPVALLAIGMAAALGAAIGLKAGVTRYRAAALISTTGMLLSPVGLWLARQIDNRWLGVLFAFALLYVAFQAYRRSAKPSEIGESSRPCVRRVGSGRFIWTRPCAYALALSGTVAGLLSGLLGIGGGFVMVPALRRYTDLDMQSAITTSLGVIALVSVAGVVASTVAGTMNWRIAMPFSAGTLIGMLGGRAFSGRLDGRHLQAGFATVSAVVAVGMIFKGIFH